MRINQLIGLISADLYRYSGKMSWRTFFVILIRKPGFCYTFWMRLCLYTRNIWLYPVYLIARLMHRHYMFKFGISIPYTVEIGRGFYIGHFGTIVISGQVKIGSNCNISQGVTIGKNQRGKKQGYPIIGNDVYIGPGAKIIGNITVGNNVAIGANCVVVDDVPNNAVVVGVPGKIASMNGTEGLLQYSLRENV